MERRGEVAGALPGLTGVAALGLERTCADHAADIALAQAATDELALTGNDHVTEVGRAAG